MSHNEPSKKYYVHIFYLKQFSIFWQPIELDDNIKNQQKSFVYEQIYR